MLNIKLPTPVYLDTQLRELTEKSGRTFEELESLKGRFCSRIAD